MSAIKKLVLANLEATKARLSEGRRWIGIKNLEAPDEVQPRAGIDKDWVSQLATFRREGSEFPPARAYQLPNGRLILAEGHHRRWALLGENETDMLCEVVDGTMEEAIVYAAGSNKSNGVKPMSPKDVTKAIEMLMQFPEWRIKTALRISLVVGCSSQKASKTRAKWFADRDMPLPSHVVAEDGQMISLRQKKRNSRDIFIGKNKGEFIAWYRGFAYRAETADGVKNQLHDIWKKEDEKRSSLSYRAMGTRLGKCGFSCLKLGAGYAGIGGWHAYGCAVVTCDFSENSASFEAIGTLKLLLCAVGRLEAVRQACRHSTRMIVLCYREFAPPKVIDLFEQAGYEFMTPDELVASLGPVIPEELIHETTNAQPEQSAETAAQQ